MGTFAFRLPDIGEGVAEAEIVAWHVAVGDMVEEDQPIADMMTDKATIEMTSPVTGKVTALAGDVGEVIPIGSTLVTFETEGESEAKSEPPVEEAKIQPEPEKPSPLQGRGLGEGQSDEKTAQPPALPLPPTPSPEGEGEQKVLASPAVRARAKDLGIDLSQVKPSAEGRIRHADLDAYLSYNAGQGYGVPAPRRADEAISDAKGEYLRDTPARRAIGDDYIAKAFEFASEADPNARAIAP